MSTRWPFPSRQTATHRPRTAAVLVSRTWPTLVDDLVPLRNGSAARVRRRSKVPSLPTACYTMHTYTHSANMRMVVVWEHTTVRCFLDHWFQHSCVYLGSHTVRIVQRAWLRFRERRRLALCMGWHD